MKKEKVRLAIIGLYGDFINGKIVIQNGETEGDVRNKIVAAGGTGVDLFYSITHFEDMVIISE